jgi:hypothetical protein
MEFQKSAELLPGDKSRTLRSGFINSMTEPNFDHERRQAHALLDALPADKLNAVRTLLEAMVEPLARTLALCEAEEGELAADTADALDRARASLARGESVPHDEILREFGLKQ